LRYKYFEEIRLQENYDLIAVAHNSDDTIETFLINLMRGTGILGLTGIKPKSGNIIRPLLFASRKDIEAFTKETSMVYRLDKSNLSNKYKRNKIRNELIPLIETIAPSFRKTIVDVMHNLNGTSMIYQSFLQTEFSKLVKEQEGIQKIEIEELKGIAFYEIIFPELLRNYGFSSDVSRNILGNLDAEPGKSFFSHTHRLLKDRSQLLITKRDSEPDESFYINEDSHSLEFPLLLNIHHENRSASFEIPQDLNIACLDEEKLVFPLILRHWKVGDYFRPLGMDQMKKLSDFFINEKFSVFEKEKVWLLVSDGKIAWICGHRLDDRFKIQKDTSRILRIEILE
jgi:tRNA(Ile)-lysidine synthase